jgi:hypothetical protein
MLSMVTLTFMSASSWSQEASDIWVGKLNLWEKEPVTDLFRITDNAKYSNQPYFFDNSRLFYTQASEIQNLDNNSTQAIDAQDGEENVAQDQAVKLQMDTWMFDFILGKSINISQSPQSEYSPTPVPNSPDMSVIRVNEKDEQELWQLDMKGKAIKHLAQSVAPVGYQVWIDDTQLLMFVLGEPNTLQRIDAFKPNAEAIVIDTNIGASLYQFEKTDWFLYTSHNDGHFLNAYNARTSNIIQIEKMPENSEYFSISHLGNIFTSDGKTLWQRKLILKGEKITPLDAWKPINIEQTECAKGISRTAISPDTSMIALVCSRPESQETTESE